MKTRLSKSEAVAPEEPANRKARSRTLSLVFSFVSACVSDNACSFHLSNKQNQCSASDSVGLIFTRSYHSTLVITTPTTTPSLVKTSLKVYITDFFLFARLNLPNVLISVAKNFFVSDFPSPCFDVPKALNFTSGGVQNRDTKKRETGNDCDVNSGLQALRKTDFSVIFLL